MLREATPDDLPRLRAIQLAALDEPWADLLEPAIDGPPLVLVTTAASGQAASSVAGLDGGQSRTEPVGYAIALPEGNVAYLAEFAIAAGHRRSGRGTRLMAGLCARLADAGFETVRLTVKQTDDQARSFYDAQGFRVRSLIPHHYEDGDGLELVRSL